MIRMLSFFLLLSTANICLSNDVAMGKLRSLYEKAAADEKYCRELLQLLKRAGHQNMDPLHMGYKAGATMMMARHSYNPFSKMSYFTEGRRMLEQAISRDKSNAELRFLRLAIQTNIPDFLNYSDNISTDRIFLENAVQEISDLALKNMILEYLKKLENR